MAWYTEWRSCVMANEVVSTTPLVISHNGRNSVICRFQYDELSESDVNDVTASQRASGRDVIWIVHGGGVSFRGHAAQGTQCFDYAPSSMWKCDSFRKCRGSIWLDLNGAVYLVDSAQSTNDRTNYLSRREFVAKLTADILPMPSSERHQCTIYIKQQGAGNGKTYDMVQMLQSNEFSHYRYFIIVTKQHSAKDVIMTEFLKQCEKKMLADIFFDKSADILSKANKKYSIRFSNKNTRQVRYLVIGTIDSFF